MELPTSPTPCPQCGAAVWIEARFCHRCGATLMAEEVPAVQPARESRVVSLLPWALVLIAVGALVAMLVGQRLGLGPRRLEPADTVVAPSR